MKTFKQFLSEDESLSVIELIRRDCQPFLADRGTTNLFRGFNPRSKTVKEVHTDLYIGTPRADRQPTDSPMWLHNALDDMFMRESGKRFRSNGLFCTPLASTANNYAVGGKALGAIFPIGKFDYAWSKAINDAYQVFDSDFDFDQGSLLYSMFLKHIQKNYKKEFKSMSNQSSNLVYNFMNSVESVTLDQFITGFLKQHGAELYEINTRLAQADKWDNEIMIVCDKFYALTDLTILSKI